MARDIRFNLMMSKEEVALLAKMAEGMQRSRGDTLRVLLRQAAREMPGVEQAAWQPLQPVGAEVQDA